MSECFVGRGVEPESYTTFQIRHLLVYDRYLSDAEVQSMYNTQGGATLSAVATGLSSTRDVSSSLVFVPPNLAAKSDISGAGVAASKVSILQLQGAADLGAYYGNASIYDAASRSFDLYQGPQLTTVLSTTVGSLRFGTRQGFAFVATVQFRSAGAISALVSCDSGNNGVER